MQAKKVVKTTQRGYFGKLKRQLAMGRNGMPLTQL